MKIALGAGAVLAGGVAWWGWEKAHRKTHPVPPGHRPEIDLPYRREFELYHNALSLCSMKVRVCMAELRVPYESYHVDLIETGAYENIRRPFLAVNPGGTVPVLVHQGHPIYESHEQIRYAAAHAPPGSPSLVPADPALRGEMERWIDRSSLTDDPINHGDESAGNAVPGLTLPLFAAMIDGIPYWKILEGALFHFDRKRPFMFLTFKVVGLRRVDALRPAMRVLARSRRQMGSHLDALENRLRDGGGPWILGEAFSLADVELARDLRKARPGRCPARVVDERQRPGVRSLLGTAPEPAQLPRGDSRALPSDGHPQHRAPAPGQGVRPRAAAGVGRARALVRRGMEPGFPLLAETVYFLRNEASTGSA